MSTPAARVLADRDAYLEAVRAANILGPHELERAAAVATGCSAADAASALVAAGVLTRFQAERLLAGRTDGFALGPYIILEQIGRGSMSRVYKARHRTMNRAVAIKVLSAELTRTAEARQLFQREVRAAGKLSHPNIVTAFDANELHDRFYLVLEFVDGPSLHALVQQRGPVPVGEACEFVRQIAHGLHHAHAHGLAHRALKPGNVLVARPTPTAPPAVKITDFGLPRVVPGPPDYLAPEAVRHPEAADARADLYSLGCAFYFLLTGHPPFEGAADEVARAHAAREVPEVNRVRPDVAPAIAAIVHRLLAKRPAGRFGSAAELLAHLDAACVPVAIPVDCVSFDLPAGGPYDSGYLTGRYALPHGSGAHPRPGSGAFAVPPAEPGPSPWAQITEATASDTAPIEPDDRTPALPPHRVLRRKRRRAAAPRWMSAVLLVSAVLLALIGISAAVKVLR
ncbi:MAG TPA: serine/threonine-protein kinase [Gemmata sp.]